MLQVTRQFLIFVFFISSVFIPLQHTATAGGLPGIAELKNYQPPLGSQLFASDGQPIGEYADQRRTLIAIADVPPMVKNAFISAEDKNFYSHHGLDANGILRGAIRPFSGQSMQGGSTITQQVAKNILLTSERTFTRKINEAVLAIRIEQAFSKDEILALYLNEIYFGMGAYGIASAAETYFGTSVGNLTLEQAAYLAALPKGPENYNPSQNYDAALRRRNWVIERMQINGFIGDDAAQRASKRPLTTVSRPIPEYSGQSAYFNEEVRRQVTSALSRDQLYRGGLSINTTLDPGLQRVARAALQRALIAYDRRSGWRGPVKTIPDPDNWQQALAETPSLRDLPEWQMAVVLKNSGSDILLGLRRSPGQSNRAKEPFFKAKLDRGSMRWATGTRAFTDVLSAGDVIYVSASANGRYELQQIPQLQGALVALDPATGHVKAMVGGFSFAQSNFNRATQAMRQPGSVFKPFVYAAALDRGYTPASHVSNEELTITGADGRNWQPANHNGRYSSSETLRTGLEQSLNTVTVRLAQEVGMDMVAQYAERFGLYDHLDPWLPMALGTGETTLLRVTNAYAMFANGGRSVRPVFISQILDHSGAPLTTTKAAACPDCAGDAAQFNRLPSELSTDSQILDPMTAYQVTSMLQGVVARGTGRTVASLGKNIAAKSGTTNDAKDAWFVGYTPNLVTGVYIGFDTPRSLGENAWGSTLAAPVFKEFMTYATRTLPRLDYPLPADMHMVYVDGRSGIRAFPGDQNRIREFFKPGTGPSDNDIFLGGSSLPGEIFSPQVDRLLQGGQTGLY
jgi:penicillin-binding protein 1A